MRVLLDTNILLWSMDRETFGAERLGHVVQELLDDPTVDASFSVVNIWEVAIKFALGRAAFRIDPVVLRE